MKTGEGLQSQTEKGVKAMAKRIRKKGHLVDAWLLIFFLPFIGQAIFVFMLSYMLGKDRVEDR